MMRVFFTVMNAHGSFGCSMVNGKAMRPKSKGRSLLVSGFCSPCFVRGNIEDLDGATVEKRSFKIITHCQNYDGF